LINHEEAVCDRLVGSNLTTHGLTCISHPCAMVRPATLILMLQLTNRSSPTSTHD